MTVHWRSTTLGELETESHGVIQTGPFGSQLHMSDYSSIGTPVVMPTNIRDLRIDAADIARVPTDHVERLARHKLRPGDIIYSRRGDVEKCALVRENESAWLCGTGCLLVRVGGPEVDTRFLSYSLSEPDTRAWISAHAVGATMPNLNTGILREVPVRLPPIGEQRGIAATLGALDDNIASNRSSQKLIEDLASAVLRSAIPLNEYGFPKYEPSTRLGGVLSVLETGSRPKGGVSVGGQGVVSLGAESIQSAGVTSTEIFKTVPHDYAAAMRRGKLEDEDILVYKDGGRPGNFIPHVSAFGHGFPVPEAVINEHVYRTRAIDGISQALLYWVLRSSWMDQEMRKRGTGVAIPSLNSVNFRDLPVPVISSEDIEMLNSKLSPLLTALLRYGAENRRLVELRDTLLPELLSGRIRVFEAEEALAGAPA